MEINLKPGKYVVAVSGGVDSVVLLDLLSHKSGIELIVAHFDHGIRKDSAADRKFVESLAKKHNLPFEYGEGKLGPKTSEALAREKRYEFLREVQKKHKADSIITAHHQDDLLETAGINLLRGTGRRGLSSLGSTKDIKRPLLNFSKKEIISYAQTHKLTWREDPTNQDEKYLRNWMRRQIISKLTATQRQTLLANIRQSKITNEAIESALDKMLAINSQGNSLNRHWFNQLPHDVAKEVLMSWLRQQNVTLDRRRVQQLVVVAKTYAPGKRADIIKDVHLEVGQKYLALVRIER